MKSVVPGQIVFLTSGAYSDWQIISKAIVKKTFVLVEVLEEFAKNNEDNLSISPFILFLTEHGYIEEIESDDVEWHLSDHWGLMHAKTGLNYLIDRADYDPYPEEWRELESPPARPSPPREDEWAPMLTDFAHEPPDVSDASFDQIRHKARNASEVIK